MTCRHDIRKYVYQYTTELCFHCVDGALLLCCSRMKTAERQYLEAFEDELSSFISRVKKRAQARVEEAVKNYEEVRVCVCVDVCTLACMVCVDALYI